MCVVSGAEADIKPDPSFQLLLVCSSGMGLILQGLFKLNYIGPIQGVSTEVPIALTGINILLRSRNCQALLSVATS